MQNLIKQEQFEIELLDLMNKNKFLEPLVFIGGTMLRLCYNLDRFSIDLDFWIIKNISIEEYYAKLKNFLSNFYLLKDCHNKHYTLLFEIKSSKYPQLLKIEIRKMKKKVPYDESIAYSEFSNKQVLLKTLTLEEMLNNKIDAFLNRCEIKDIYDIEFLVKKGMKLNVSGSVKDKIIKQINNFKKTDYTVRLGSLLKSDIRKYYIKNNFKIIKNLLTTF